MLRLPIDAMRGRLGALADAFLGKKPLHIRYFLSIFVHDKTDVYVVKRVFTVGYIELVFCHIWGYDYGEETYNHSDVRIFLTFKNTNYGIYRSGENVPF